jgi:hypothetical protein
MLGHAGAREAEPALDFGDPSFHEPLEDQFGFDLVLT